MNLRRYDLPVLLLTLLVPAVAQDTPTSQHPAAGSWYGKAVQLCPDPVSSCIKGVLTMTPTLTSDGHFLGNDTFSLAGFPFGPHTTAHGVWKATSPTRITADYVFLNVPFPAGNVASTGVARFCWKAEAIDQNTMTGFVNFYVEPAVPTVWESLTPDQDPTLPKELTDAVQSPSRFYTDPKECNFNPSCPLIFKFKILRVKQQ